MVLQNLTNPRKFRTILPLLETPKRVILLVTTPGIGGGLAKEK